MEKIRASLTPERTKSRVLEELPQALVEFHLRRGRRLGCTCKYCQKKQEAFWKFYRLGVRYIPKTPEEREDIGYFIWQARKELRKQYRAELAQLKAKMLGEYFGKQTNLTRQGTEAGP